MTLLGGRGNSRDAFNTRGAEEPWATSTTSDIFSLSTEFTIALIHYSARTTDVSFPSSAPWAGRSIVITLLTLGLEFSRGGCSEGAVKYPQTLPQLQDP